MYKETGNLFRQKRETLKLTQGQVANKSKCTLAVISNLERGLSNFAAKALQDKSSASRILKAYKIAVKEIEKPLLKDGAKNIKDALSKLS